MAGLTESEKRDFVSQIIELLTKESASFKEKGYNPASQLETLSIKKEAADAAEIAQQKAAAAAKDATRLSNEALDEAYSAASNQADLISGLLGKEDELVKKMRKFRN